MEHPSHKHWLKLKRSSAPYKCNGCDELGFGAKYRCNKMLFKCNFHLHEECALPDGAKKHRFFESDFTFHNYKSPADPAACVKKQYPFFKRMINCIFCNYKSPAEPHRFCVACGKYVGGFGYRSSRNEERVLHPCCLNLPLSIPINLNLPDHNVCTEAILNLAENTPSDCQLCRNERKGWAYVSICGNHCYHVACIQESRLESWKKNRFNQQSTSSLGVSEIIKVVLEVIIPVVLGATAT